MTRKLTYEHVKNYIEKAGYKLISDNYEKSSKKLEVECSYGHRYMVSFDNFRSGKRCPMCNGNAKCTYKEVKEYIESFGYILLSEEYINSSTYIDVKCPEDHIYKVKFANFKIGYKCPYCANVVKYTYDEVKKYIESYGYELLSKEYKNAKTHIWVKCPNGHGEYQTTFTNFKRGSRCNECGNKRIGDTLRHSYNYIKSSIESEHGYKLISKEYKNNATPLEVECPKGHRFSISYYHWHEGQRCSVCQAQNYSSKAEKEILYYLKNIYDGKINPNDRNIIKNPNNNHFLELDIYLPEINKAIEFNGTYWHSFPERKLCDKIKKEECNKIGIDLLVVLEEDWLKDKNSCFNNIEKFIGE